MSSNKTRQTYLLKKFFTPSAIGIVICIVVASLAVVRQIPTIQPFLQAFSSGSLENTWLYSYGHNINLFLDSATVSTIAIFGFWMIVGLFVYLVIKSIRSSVKELSDDLNFWNYILPPETNRDKPIELFFIRLVFRLLILILSIFYIVLSIKLYADWIRAHSQPTLRAYIELFIVVVLFSYGLTILLRFLMIRQRLFGSSME